MATHYFLIVFITFISFCSHAQKGNNALNIMVEGGYAGDQYDPGYGAFLKGLYGVGKHGQLTLMAGVSKFRAKDAPDQLSSTTRLVPFLAGYKQHFYNFYIEPQVGYGELGGKQDIGGDYARPSLGAFFWAFGVGVNVKRFDFGLRYQGAQATGGSSAGLWNDKIIQFVGLHAGYAIFKSN
jgi:hypothetical protein